MTCATCAATVSKVGGGYDDEEGHHSVDDIKVKADEGESAKQRVKP